MKVTIEEIARQAGVSIATVSHVINATRYVSPELVKKVRKIVEENQYKKDIEYTMQAGRHSQIALLVPCFQNYPALADILSEKFSEAGYTLSVSITNDDIKTEKNLLTALLSSKSTGGIILVPAADNSRYYENVLNRAIPFVLLARCFDDNRIDSITTDHEAAVYKSINYLLRCGHEKIGIITEKKESSISREQISGYQKALAVHEIPFQDELALYIDNRRRNAAPQLIRAFYEQTRPTALLSGIQWVTPRVLRFLDDQGLKYPHNISFIGNCHSEWTQIIEPPLTLIEEDFESMGNAAAARILEKITDADIPAVQRRIPATFLLRKSARMVGRGPFGEDAIPIEKMALTEAEAEKLKDGHFKVGISFHYGNTAWTRLHESGIRETLEKYGIKILSVTEAHFNPELQVTQLEGLRMQKPDAIIAIPSNDVITAAKFKEMAKEVKLIFISNIPRGMAADEYASCVSVNEREGGFEAGVLLGEYFKNHHKVHVGFIAHGTPFYGTHLRDSTAEQVINENYPYIDIVSIRHFHTIEGAYTVCKEMIASHPELDALYISWDDPALQVIRALKELKREDIAIFTFDLDMEIASYLARGDMVKGLVTQRPYLQGKAVALATAKSLLGEREYKYIGVSPYVVQRNNLQRAWEDVFHTAIPQELASALK